METLRITATSNLLPRNKAWNVIAEDWSLDFGSYGDWAQLLLQGESSSLLAVLCLEDLFDLQALQVRDGVSLEKEVELRLGPLLQYLQNSPSPTIVAYYSWAQESPIHAARTLSIRRRLARYLEDILYTFSERFPGLHLLSLNDVFAQYGMNNCLDTRNYYLSRCRFSHKGLDCLVRGVSSILIRLTTAAKKVLVLDCDNTLWGGVIGEAGLDGIVLGSDGLGRAYTDFQRAAKYWAQNGILLVLLSKNNEQDVWDVFAKHPGMELQKSDIVAHRINWRPKAENLVELADELGLGAESFIFWDDSQFEQEAMRELLPQVQTIAVPSDITQWPNYLLALDEFASLSSSEDDRHKVEHYRQRAAYMAEQQLVTNEDDFLRSLNMTPMVHPLATETFSRAEQLCMKTNQFNLRTIRYGKSELQHASTTSDNEAFLLQLDDRFGHHGIVGFCLVRIVDDMAFLDTFLLSCRVLGRRLESWMFNHLIEVLKARQCSSLVAEYIPTAKNSLASSFLADHGMKAVSQQDEASQVSAFKAFYADAGIRFKAELDCLEAVNTEYFNHE